MSYFGHKPFRNGNTVEEAPQQEVQVPVPATVQLVDSGGSLLGPAMKLASGSSSTVIAPDGVIQPGDRSGMPIGGPVQVRSGETSRTVSLPIPVKWMLPAGTSSLTWTVTADEVGTYTAYADDGGSGTWTYKIGAGSFAAVSGTIALALGDVVTVARTVSAADGSSVWTP
jgi:hypothetical protein